MKTNFLRKSENEEKVRSMLIWGRSKICSYKKLPKMAELAQECSPAFQSEKIRERFNYSCVVLAVGEFECFLEMLEKALDDRYYRNFTFQTKWELPIRVALGIARDLLAGRDVFNPSAKEIRESELFSLTVKTYIPDEMVAERNKLFKPEQWIEELIKRHHADLASDDAPIEWIKEVNEEFSEHHSSSRKPIELISTEEAIANLHPIVRHYSKAVISTPGALDFYETFSELLKAYNSKEEWEKDSWEQRWEKVPEYLYIGPRGRVDLDQMMASIFTIDQMMDDIFAS